MQVTHIMIPECQDQKWMKWSKLKGLLCLISNILISTDANIPLKNKAEVVLGCISLTPGICWEVFPTLSTPGTGVASQLLTGGEISFAKPVLQVRFTKHLPTSLMFIITAPLLPCHGRLCTSFPGINLSKVQIFSRPLIRHETRAVTQEFIKCFINFSQPQAVRFQWAMPQNSWQWSHTSFHAWMAMVVLHCDSSSSVEESKNQSLLLFKDKNLLAMLKLLHCLEFLALPEFSIPALLFIQVMLRSLLLCTHSWSAPR